MARKKRKKSELLEVAKNMPMNFHRLPGMGYDPDKSKVLDWIANQPELLEWIFQQLRSTGYIVYDPQLGAWHGVDFRKAADES